MFPLKDDIPTRRFPFLTVLIIVACVVVYFVIQRGGFTLGEIGDERAIEYGAIPYELTHPGKNCEAISETRLACEGQPGIVGEADPQAPWWVTVFTSMFLHGGLLHLGGNMLFLWIFGNNIEDRLGHVRYLLFYLAAGIAATLAHVAVQPSSTVPVVGASGAIAGVLAGYFLMYPSASVRTLLILGPFITITRISALILIGFWFVTQVFSGVAAIGESEQTSGVAFWAHVGGFVAGLPLVLLLRQRQRSYDFAFRR